MSAKPRTAKTPQQPPLSNTAGGLTVKAYRGDGMAMLAFDLDQKLTPNLAGFAVQRTAPGRQPVYLLNRLNFANKITGATTPEERVWTPSNEAPFQKFRWLDVPDKIDAGDYHYQITALYFNKGHKLKAGPSAEASLELMPRGSGVFEFGFTRGYLSSQAYAEHFHNAPIRPAGAETLEFDIKPFEKQYEWLGFRARKLVFEVLDECLADKDITVDLFAYDLDEPDFVRGLQKLGPRLRAFLDDAPLHTKPGALEREAHRLLMQSAGAANVKTGHFHRFAHDKVLVVKKHGAPVKVLTGSANFSVRGLYVQANNVMVFDDATTAELYEAAFEQAFTNEAQFTSSEIADGYHEVNGQRLPHFSVAFSPHKTAELSLGKVADAINHATSSVLFAVMELGGSGPVLSELQVLPANPKLFSYGMTQTIVGLKVYKPGQANGIIVPFTFLKDKVPGPFRAEYSGGIGQVIHHKFVVVDFNGASPMVFTGSSNLASGGEEANGDNLLAIDDATVAEAYAIEAIRLVDHYHFRVAMQAATDTKPLMLQSADARTKWWMPYYDKKNIKYRERVLFTSWGQPLNV